MITVDTDLMAAMIEELSLATVAYEIASRRLECCQV